MDRQLKKRRFTLKKIAWILTVSAFLTIVLYSFLFGDRSSKLNVDFGKLTTATVTRGPFLDYITLTGHVVPIVTVYLTAVEGGRVEEKYLDAGEFVEKGEPILKLENTNLMMEIMRRESEFTDQQNRLRQTKLSIDQNTVRTQQEIVNTDYNLRQSQREFERQKELLEKSATSQQEDENAKYNYEYYKKRKQLAQESLTIDSTYREHELKQMEESLKNMQRNLDFVRKKLENLTIKATVSGHLTALDAELGESKSSGQLLGQIDVLDGFKIRCTPDEHYLLRIMTGLKGTFKLTNSPEEYTCTIGKIYPKVVGGSFMIDLFFTGKEPERIRNGQTIRVHLELGDPLEALLLPRGGFWSSTGGQYVYVIDKSGDFAVKRQVKIGRYNPDNFEVLEGLEEGERVIISSYDNFGDIDKLILKKK